MKFKLGKRGYYRSPKGTLKIATQLPEKVNEVCKEYESRKGLSPVEIAGLEWKKSQREMSMTEFARKRDRTKWRMP